MGNLLKILRIFVQTLILGSFGISRPKESSSLFLRCNAILNAYRGAEEIKIEYIHNSVKKRPI